MKVRWYPYALEALQQTAYYITINFSESSCNKFLREVVRIENLLCTNPHLGKIEPLLEGLPQVYRSVVVSHINKLIYRIEGDIIYISDLWDCRRDPSTLAAQVK